MCIRDRSDTDSEKAVVQKREGVYWKRNQTGRADVGRQVFGEGKHQQQLKCETGSVMQ